jgi:hypothetical protein
MGQLDAGDEPGGPVVLVDDQQVVVGVVEDRLVAS